MSTITFDQLNALDDIDAEAYPTAFVLGGRVRNGWDVVLRFDTLAFRFQIVCSNQLMGSTCIPTKLAGPLKECGLDLWEGMLTEYIDDAEQKVLTKFKELSNIVRSG